MLVQQARTRAVLAALGIPLWAARREPTDTVPVISVWNRLNEQIGRVGNTDIQPVIDAQPMISPITESSITVAPPLVTVDRRLASNLIGQTIHHQPVIRQPFAQTSMVRADVAVIEVLRFSVEARVIGNWIVLVSIHSLNHPDRNTLWKNLTQAFAFDQQSDQSGRLDWPLAEGTRWQHNQGAPAALLGFLSRFGADRRIGLIGELPDAVITDRLERLPSLDELLQEPLKKRNLWRLLTGKIH